MRAWLLLSLCLLGCGAKSPLRIDEAAIDAGMDAGTDAGSDAGVDAGPFVCPTEPCDCFAEGEVEWLRKELCPDRRDLDRWLARTRSRAAFEAELAEPGQGRFGALIGHPEFTAFLADCGHALLVEAGDALVLPSHGLTRCALHSVWCASDRPTYALSAALRQRRD